MNGNAGKIENGSENLTPLQEISSFAEVLKEIPNQRYCLVEDENNYSGPCNGVPIEPEKLVILSNIPIQDMKQGIELTDSVKFAAHISTIYKIKPGSDNKEESGKELVLTCSSLKKWAYTLILRSGDTTPNISFWTKKHGFQNASDHEAVEKLFATMVGSFNYRLNNTVFCEYSIL